MKNEEHLAKKVCNGLANIEDLVQRTREAFDELTDEREREREGAQRVHAWEISSLESIILDLKSQLVVQKKLYDNLYEFSKEHLAERNEARKIAAFYRNALLEVLKLRKCCIDGIGVLMKLDEIIDQIDADKTAPVLPWEVFTQ